MEKNILFLKKLIGESPALLQPSPDPHSITGYFYPQVKDFFDEKDGNERIILEDLANKNCLERKFFDKIHLCPYCGRHDLNIRDVCPECNSSDISIVEMLHHIKCAYVAPETEFQNGTLYMCPKCHDQLRHSGLDYERSRRQYLCRESKHIFTDPKVDCCCLSCSQRFDREKSISKSVYSYQLTEEGIATAKRGYFHTAETQQGILDAHTGLYTFAFFQQQLVKEIEKAKRFKRPLSIAMLTIEDHDRVVDLFNDMALVVRENIRAMDVAARYNDTKIVIIFPELARRGIQTPVKRISAKIGQMTKAGKGFKVNFDIAAFPEDGKTPGDLMKHFEAK